jgi:hypothetical protein
MHKGRNDQHNEQRKVIHRHGDTHTKNLRFRWWPHQPQASRDE